MLGALRSKGVRGSVARARRMLRERQALRREAAVGRAFDEERGIETTDWVRVPALDTDSPNRELAVRYQPSSVDEVEHLLSKLPVDPAGFTFVDFGAGKGRVLLLAAERGFERVIGVEFSASLVEVAQKNVASLGERAGRVSVVHMDATEFDPPPDPLVLYFFNPFQPPVLRQVLSRIRRSLDASPRPAYVVLTGPPASAAVVEELAFEPLDVERGGWRDRGVWHRA
jgi:SAM-dependent methyltransferase